MRYRNTPRWLNESRIQFDRIDEDGEYYTFIKKFVVPRAITVTVEVNYNREEHRGTLVVGIGGSSSSRIATVQGLMCNPRLVQEVSEFCAQICPSGNPYKLDTDLLEELI